MTIKRNRHKAVKYRTAINKYCGPDCTFGYGIETHHIVPLSKGGNDEYQNFIILCADCHKRGGYHSKYSKKRLSLLVHKLYIEKVCFGRTSEELNDKEFGKLLKPK